MIDETLRPYLIECNHLPSWGTDSPLDDAIKSQVITQALKAINVKASDRSKFTNATKKACHLRLSNQHSLAHDSTPDDDANSQQIDENSYISDAKRKQPALFESNSAERQITAIYAKHAPEKLSKLPALLERFRGYEQWLVMKVQNKYENDDSEDDNTDESSDSSAQEQEHTYSQHIEYQEEERILEGYDRIYPPKPNSNGRISPATFKDMEDYVSEVDSQQQRRLLCPLQQIRSNSDTDNDNTEIQHHQRWSRADSWMIGGNIHVRKNSMQPKIIAPPTQRQVEFAQRLSQGFSTGNINISKTSLQQRKSRILNHDLFYEEINPFYHLNDRVAHARELSKEVRKRVELKLSQRVNPLASHGVALRQQVVDLGLPSEQSCLRLRAEDKFYTKKKYQTNQSR